MAFIVKILVCFLALSSVSSLPHRRNNRKRPFLPKPVSGHIPRPGLGHLPKPGRGNIPTLGLGHIPKPGLGQILKTGLGHIPKPSLGHIPKPGFGHIPKPGSGHIPAPELGHVPSPSVDLGVEGDVIGSGPIVQSDVLLVNKLYGGSYDPHAIWAADCNFAKSSYHKWIIAIWDDLNNFKDLDKIKCSGSNSGVTLDLNDNIVLDIDQENHGLSQCPENYVITALWDKDFGFPHLNKAKCSRVTNGYLDNYDIITLYTEHKFGGPYGSHEQWNLECPPDSAMVGIKREHARTVSINCAHLQPLYDIDVRVQ